MMTNKNNHTFIEQFIEQVRFNQQGLISTIAQDYHTKKVLMLAWQNKDSLVETLNKREMIYYSRSRQKLWHKGESSGHTQKVISLSLDCDGDALLALVEQKGGIACHTGRESCFYKQFSTKNRTGIEITHPILKDPKSIYS